MITARVVELELIESPESHVLGKNQNCFLDLVESEVLFKFGGVKSQSHFLKLGRVRVIFLGMQNLEPFLFAVLESE